MKRKQKRSQDWSVNEMFTAVVKTAEMNGTELEDYCAEESQVVDRLKGWRESCFAAIRQGRKVDPEKRSLRKEVKALKRELKLKEKALGEIRALMILQEKSRPIQDQRGEKGRMISPEQRQEILNNVAEAVSKGCRKRNACDVVGISVRTLENWQKRGDLNDGRTTREFEPENKLSKEERAKILSLVNSKRFRNQSPAQIVPILVDEGEYVASESTIYRILQEERMLTHRQTSRPAKKRQRPDPFMANGPNQVRTWDITYLPTQVKGVYFYLYMIIDIYSRKIVGWEVHDEESAQNAANLITKTHQNEGAVTETVLHSDNGSPMKGATMLATLQRLGILPSFSRPSVSNDNPYSEALFRTLKYRPEYPHERFESVGVARKWVAGFVHWYNMEHRHSALKFVTPHQRHEGKHQEIFTNRKLVYEKAKESNPKRWAGKTRNWDLEEEVYLNPGRAPKKKVIEASSKTEKVA